MEQNTHGSSQPVPARVFPGLSGEDAGQRLEQYGPNTVAKAYKVTFLSIAKEELTEPMILLLLAVGVAYTLVGEFRDALTLYAIIVTLVLVEIWTEYRAKKAIASLATIAAPETKVIRDGQIRVSRPRTSFPGTSSCWCPGPGSRRMVVLSHRSASGSTSPP